MSLYPLSAQVLVRVINYNYHCHNRLFSTLTPLSALCGKWKQLSKLLKIRTGDTVQGSTYSPYTQPTLLPSQHHMAPRTFRHGPKGPWALPEGPIPGEHLESSLPSLNIMKQTKLDSICDLCSFYLPILFAKSLCWVVEGSSCALRQKLQDFWADTAWMMLKMLR